MPKKAELVGKKFGKLLVISPDERKWNRPMWKCQCECGNIISTCSNHLLSGHTTSCGCYGKSQRYNATFKDLTNKTFGKLTVIEKAYSKNNFVFYKCKCECGNICYIRGHSLKNGHTVSCGCIHSKGEEKISQLLNENNINFVKEKIFEDCKLPSGYPARFDFYVEDSYIIEYDGEQHFKPTFGQKNFEFVQFSDNLKNEYCKSHNIPLIRIPYYKLQELVIEDLIL